MLCFKGPFSIELSSAPSCPGPREIFLDPPTTQQQITDDLPGQLFCRKLKELFGSTELLEVTEDLVGVEFLDSVQGIGVRNVENLIRIAERQHRNHVVATQI